ncbi:DUF4468 domain-containing protein [Mucilaginibacter paludis]|nr:DUF4468 domain-containing protein [Mucilaginibacter paludis]
MNKLIVLFFCLALSKAAMAQKDSLALDEHGKYIYYKIVSMNKYTADTLYQRSLRFFKNIADKKSLKITSADPGNMGLAGTGFFTVYKTAITKHPDGQIAYQLKLEVKDAKYRYWLTNFVYTPYFRDRYNNYVPQNNVEVPLEKLSKNIAEKDLNSYLDESALFGRQLGERLKKYLTNVVVVEKKAVPKVISIGKW